MNGIDLATIKALGASGSGGLMGGNQMGLVQSLMGLLGGDGPQSLGLTMDPTLGSQQGLLPMMMMGQGLMNAGQPQEMPQLPPQQLMAMGGGRTSPINLMPMNTPPPQDIRYFRGLNG